MATPTKETLDQAMDWLRKRYPDTPIDALFTLELAGQPRLCFGATNPPDFIECCRQADEVERRFLR